MASPFTADGRIDEAGAIQLTQRLADSGLGVFVLGTTGEAASVPQRERLRLVEIALRAAEGRVPVYAGIGENCLAHSVEAAQAYEAAGVHGVVAHLPSYYPLSGAEMMGYFKALHDATTGNLMVYNIPPTTHMSIPVDVVEALAELPRIVGYKDSERNLERAGEVFRRCGGREDFALFMGCAALSVEALKLGFVGLVPSGGNLIPQLWADLLAAAQKGDWERAETLQTQTDTIAKIFQGGRSLGQSLAALKGCLHLLGVCPPHVLPPLQPASPETMATLQAAIAAEPAIR